MAVTMKLPSEGLFTVDKAGGVPQLFLRNAQGIQQIDLDALAPSDSAQRTRLGLTNQGLLSNYALQQFMKSSGLTQQQYEALPDFNPADVGQTLGLAQKISPFGLSLPGASTVESRTLATPGDVGGFLQPSTVKPFSPGPISSNQQAGNLASSVFSIPTGSQTAAPSSTSSFLAGVQQAVMSPEIQAEMARFPGLTAEAAAGNLATRQTQMEKKQIAAGTGGATGGGATGGGATGGGATGGGSAGGQIIEGTGGQTAQPTGAQPAQPTDVVPLETERTGLVKTLTDLFAKMTGRGSTLQAEQQKLQVPENTAKLQTLNTQIAQRNAELQALDVEFQKQQNQISAQPIPQGLLIGQQAQLQKQQEMIKRTKAVELAALGIQQQALQGNIDLARSLARETVDYQFQDVQQQIDATKLFLDLNRDEIERTDKKAAAQLEMQIKLREQDLRQQKDQAALEYKAFIDQQEFALKERELSLKEQKQPEQEAVQSLAQKYPDAGISLQDSLNTAQSKLQNSRLYQEAIRPPQAAVQINMGRQLSIQEAQTLGVPIGTTIGDVVGMTPTTTQQRTTIEALEGALGKVNQLEGLAGGLSFAESAAGRIGQGAKLLAGALAQTNTQATTFNSFKEGILSNLSRATGERGVLTDQDIARVRKLLPSLTDTKDVVQQKFIQLRQLFGEFQVRSASQPIVQSVNESKPTKKDFDYVSNLGY